MAIGMSNWGWGGGWTDTGRPLRQLVRRFEVENSILLGRDVFHHIRQQGPAVAWSIGDDVYFNAGRLPIPETKEDIVFLTGVNKHELSHVMYTPTPMDVDDLLGHSHEMVTAMTKPDYAAAFNILEDQRIETLYLKRYANGKPYFMSAFTRIILESEVDGVLDVAYLLARGRRYLPVKVRRFLKKRFKVQAIVPDIRRIIDSYLKLNLFRTDDLRKAHLLIEEFNKLINDHNLWDNTGFDEMPKLDTCQTVKHMQKARSKTGFSPDDDDSDEVEHEGPDPDQLTRANVTDQKEVAKTVQDVADDVNADSDTDGAGTDSEDAQAESSGTQGTGDIAGDATGSDDKASDGAGTGKGSGQEQIQTDDDLQEALSGLLTEALASEEVQREVHAVRTFMRNQPDVDAPQIREWGPVPAHLPNIARKVSRKLQKLEVEIDPFWDRRQSSGRLNVQRVMTDPSDLDHAFDRWEDGGMGGNDQEWVVLLDCSGSMTGHMKKLAESAWIIKRAGDLMRATVTVFAYGSANFHRVVYKPQDRAGATALPGMPELGGTEPGSALLRALQVLSQSRKATKGLLVMTDGSWHAENNLYSDSALYNTPFANADDIIKAMNSHGVISHLVYLGSSYTWMQGRPIDPHGCRTAAAITNVEELPTIMESLIAANIRRN